MIILQPMSSSESSSQKSKIGSMTLLSIQFSLQYYFSVLTTCSSAFVHTSFVIFPKAAYVSSLTSFNRKVVLILATKPLTCAHVNSIELSSQCRTGVLMVRDSSAVRRLFSTCCSRGTSESSIYEKQRICPPTLGQHISTFRGYLILFSIRNPYIYRFTNHFSIHS